MASFWKKLGRGLRKVAKPLLVVGGIAGATIATGGAGGIVPAVANAGGWFRRLGRKAGRAFGFTRAKVETTGNAIQDSLGGLQRQVADAQAGVIGTMDAAAGEAARGTAEGYAYGIGAGGLLEKARAFAIPAAIAVAGWFVMKGQQGGRRGRR